MTLVAIVFSAGEFVCCADTRISGGTQSGKGPASLVDTYGKIFVIPGRFAVEGEPRGGNLGTFEIGAAFAGGTLISSTIISLVTNILSNLHSDHDTKPPSFEDLVQCVVRVSDSVFEEMKWKHHSPEFSFFLFGFCPRNKSEKLYSVGLDFSSGSAEVQASQLDVTDGGIYTIGSGRHAFKSIVEAEHPSGLTHASLPSLMYRVIATGLDKSTGGGITVAKANKHSVRLVPVGVPRSMSDLETEVDVTISGLRTDRIGDVGEYSIGRDMMGAGIEIAQNNQWLVRLGFDIKNTAIEASHRNLASLQYALAFPPADGSKIDLGGKDYLICAPVLYSGKQYLSCSCSECSLVTPLIEVRSESPQKRPFKNGWVTCTCAHCRNLSRVPAEQVFLK